jgi:uncharacterized membrane protein YhaH (DUF805 family)
MSRVGRRIGRLQYWLGSISIFGATIFIGVVLMVLGFADVKTVSGTVQLSTGESQPFSSTTFTLKPWAWIPLSILMSIAWLAFSIERRHDRGNSGVDAIVFAVASVVNQVLHAFQIGEGIPLFIFDCLMLAAGLYMLVVLGFLRGTPGPNQYGPDPLSREPALARP